MYLGHVKTTYEALQQDLIHQSEAAMRKMQSEWFDLWSIDRQTNTASYNWSGLVEKTREASLKVIKRNVSWVV